MNILIEYLYRDAGNNKKWGNVVFSNKMICDVSILEEDIKNALIEGEFFVAEDVCIPTLYFEHYDDQLDHGWHEFFSVNITAENQNDNLNRDISDFINKLNSSRLANLSDTNRQWKTGAEGNI